MRIYVDESGTHASDWLVIGMLFVPDHGLLHSNLCAVKETHKYFNGRADRKARYKETHFAEFKKPRDAIVGKAWIDHFLSSSAVFRSVVVDWSTWQGRFFGDPFEPDALKKRSLQEVGRDAVATRNRKVSGCPTVSRSSPCDLRL